MAAQLDILALEPFHGGGRRAMLVALMRCSRHRWTLLKLPPRRIDRRLTSAANWFAEHLLRHFSGHVDLLFTSDAMNLATLHRLVPDLARRPSIVYFHENRLPDLNATRPGPFDLIHLGSALAATEIWFNSAHHHRDFMERATALAARHPELPTPDPMRVLRGKASIVPPATDLKIAARIPQRDRPPRRVDTVFVETRDADMRLLNETLSKFDPTGRRCRLITVGPVDSLADRWHRTTLREADEVGQLNGLFESEVFLSARPSPAFDDLFVRALLAGCRPVVPAGGVYPELIPGHLHDRLLSDPAPQAMAAALETAMTDAHWRHERHDWPRSLASLDAMTVSRQIDERLDLIARRRINAA